MAAVEVDVGAALVMASTDDEDDAVDDSAVSLLDEHADMLTTANAAKQAAPIVLL